MSKEVYRSFEGKLDVDCRDGYIILELKDFWEIRFLTVDGSDDMVRIRKEFLSENDFSNRAINEQISNFAQTYPTNLKASSNEALLFMRRYRFANCSCFSCCFKDAYPSSNVQ